MKNSEKLWKTVVNCAFLFLTVNNCAIFLNNCKKLFKNICELQRKSVTTVNFGKLITSCFFLALIKCYNFMSLNVITNTSFLRSFLFPTKSRKIQITFKWWALRIYAKCFKLLSKSISVKIWNVLSIFSILLTFCQISVAFLNIFTKWLASQAFQKIQRNIFKILPSPHKKSNIFGSEVIVILIGGMF